MGMNMVTTVMAFSVSAFFVLFVFTRLLCARLHLSRAAAAAEGYNVRRPPAPAHPAVLCTYPSFRALRWRPCNQGFCVATERESESFSCGRGAGGARDPRPGAVRGDDLPHRQARRRRPATAAGAGGIAVEISICLSFCSSLLVLLLVNL